MRNKKTKSTISDKAIVGIVCAVGLLFAVTSASANFSFRELIARYTAEDIADRIYEDNNLGDMFEGEGIFGAIERDVTTITNPFTFEQTVTISGTTALTGAVSSTGVFSGSGAFTNTGETSVEGFTQGGGCSASTTAVATELWTEADLLASNCFVYSGTTALSSAAITITLPASTTMTTLLPSAGKSRSWFYDPSGYDAATTTTFAAGTGIILMEPDDDSSHNVVIAGATSMATIDCMRRSDTDVYCLVTEFSDAD